MVTLEEFFESIEASARIGRWEQIDQIQIATLRLTGSARVFYQSCAELHVEGTTWQLLKALLSEGIKIPTQTNTILQSCKRRDRVGTRLLKSLRTDVGHWHRK